MDPGLSMTADPKKNPQLPAVTAGARIGLLGGSFNPAHRGHLYISDAGLKRLRLDQVWWLVSPGNPLKQKGDLSPLDQRLEGARKITRGTNIKVLDFEGPLGLVYTIDTLKALKDARGDVYFVWLMGADCFAELHKWKSWDEIMNLVPIAVFSRPGYSARALAGEAACKYAEFRHQENKIKTLAVTDPPGWGYIEIAEQDISSTKLR
ncbi:MAG: nicotinate-nicotinamide nucleotide adenylyltransferase [Proteobacteria bacterium]|nr:nicotinate-nicotinamide nucleotide adenylyltransferase [Pseudomonadota bacterium]